MSYDYCDYEGPEFYDESWHVARKPHMCAECSTVIRPGTKYLKCCGKWDGDFDVFKQHEECLAACLAARSWMNNNCVPFGGLIEWYEEWGHDTRKEWPKKLRDAMAKVFIKRRRNLICGLYVYHPVLRS